MRRIIAAIAILLISAPVVADELMVQDVALDGPVMWEGGGRLSSYYYRDPMPQMVQQTLSMQREPGMDNWTWRERVETSLVSLGPQAAPYLQSELLTRDGFEADAIQVALFRLDNMPLSPRESLENWGQKHFGISPISADASSLKIFRVMDGRDGVGLRELFPHHLFYVLQHKATRLLVALASDAKVQPLEDDAALARFIRMEGLPQTSLMDKSRLASAAALLMIARDVTPYHPDVHPVVDTDLHIFRYTLQFEGYRETAALTFNPDGTLETLASGTKKIEEKPAAPITAPTTAAPPPLMPE